MRVLVDECVPRFLRRLLGHEAQTAQDCGWGGIKNGELLSLAGEQFEVFLTSDKNLRYQQNLSKRKIAIIELPTNRRRIVMMLVPKIIETLEVIAPRAYVQIDWPESE
jgi:hypothetical protein